VIDEYTSVVDRNVAKAASVSLSRYIKKWYRECCLSTCHHDIIDWLEPDWVLNTDTGELLHGFFLSDQKSISKFIAQQMIVGNV
jgi:ABC-type ATPase with predicted acetyltransferase domain